MRCHVAWTLLTQCGMFVESCSVRGGGFLVGKTARELFACEEIAPEAPMEIGQATNIDRLDLSSDALRVARSGMARAVDHARAREDLGTSLAELGAVQRRIADMAVRIYVAESLVRRTGGLIDALHARLDAEGADAAAHASDAIDEYAIELAIVQVFADETLAAVIQHACEVRARDRIDPDLLDRQRHGGCGDGSGEDGREACRALIPALLMRRAMTEALPVLAFMQGVDAELTHTSGDAIPDGPLGREIHAVDQAKRLVAYTTRLFLQRKPAELAYRQQHLETFAEMITDLYAMESAVSRTAQLIHRHGEEKVKFERDLITLFLSDASDRLAANARRIFGNDTAGAELEHHLGVIARLASYEPLGILDARARIAEHVVAGGTALG